MRGPSINPTQPLDNERQEHFAQLMAYGDPDLDGEVVVPGECYRRSGFRAQTDRGFKEGARRILKRLQNGVQARIDFLVARRVRDLSRKAVVLDERRMKDTQARQQEVDNKLDHLWALASKERPRLTSQGRPIMDLDGNPILEPANMAVLLKIAELQGVDAGMFVRQSRTGKMNEGYNDLTDDAVKTQLIAALEEYGLTVVAAESRVAESPEDPEPREDGSPRKVHAIH